jgi:hypothetical protein
VVGLLEKEYAGTKPEDPKLKIIQSKIDEWIGEDPALPRKYALDEIATEQYLINKLALEGILATASDVCSALVASGKVKI